MTADEIAAMPRELRDAGSEGQTLKQAWETCEKSADLIEDLIAQIATERQARARILASYEEAVEQAEADQIKIEAQAWDAMLLRELVGYIAGTNTDHVQVALAGNPIVCQRVIDAARAALAVQP